MPPLSHGRICIGHKSASHALRMDEKDYELVVGERDYLVRADIKPLVNLYRVCTDDFSINPLRQFDGSLCLADSSSAGQNDNLMFPLC